MKSAVGQSTWLRHGVINVFGEFLRHTVRTRKSGSFDIRSTFFFSESHEVNPFRATLTLIPCHVANNHWALAAVLQTVLKMSLVEINEYVNVDSECFDIAKSRVTCESFSYNAMTITMNFVLINKD